MAASPSATRRSLHPLSAAERTPAIVQLDRTKGVLAAKMGTTSETLSRTHAKFRDQKLLRVKGNTITLTKPRDLQHLLQSNLSEL